MTGLTHRQAEILNIARASGRVMVEELARRFEVSAQTIRKDLNDLCERRSLTRIHGGAIIASGVENLAYEARRFVAADEKKAIGAAAASLIPNGCSLFINIGTTTEEVATALAAGVMTVLMGLVGNAPLAIAAGLGVNGVVAFQMAPTMTWAQAFGLVVLEGLCIVIMAASGVRERIINAIPEPLKIAITVGIGLYIALVGLVSAGFVTRTPDAAGSTVPVRMGLDGHLSGWPIAIFCLGLLLMIVLLARGVPGAVLISIVVATVVAVLVNSVFHVEGWGLVTPSLPSSVVSSPDFGLFGRVDLFGGFVSAGVIAATIFLFTLVLSGFFDAMGTITSVADEAGLTRDGRVEGMGKILMVDGAGAIAGGVTGSAPNTVFLESAAGVGEGARTGLASVVTGGLFLVALLFTPLAAIVPAQAAAPALVVIGGLMMTQIRRIPWQDTDFTIPVFLTVAIIPFTYSITNGIGAGLVSYVVLRICKGRWPGWLMTGLALMFAVYFGVDLITGK